MPKPTHRMRYAVALFGVFALAFGCREKAEPEIASKKKVAVAIKHPGYKAKELFEAVKEGDAEDVAKLIENGADTNAKDDSGLTPLMSAVVTNKRNLVRLLADKVDLEQRDDSGNTALILASMSGGYKASDREGPPALADSASGDQPSRPADTVEVLLKAGAKPNAQNDSGYTALMMASEEKKMDILLQHHANIDAADRDGRTALMLAALECQDQQVKYLLTKGASRNSRDLGGKTAGDLVRSFRVRTKAKIDEIRSRGSGDFDTLNEQSNLEKGLECIERSQAIMSL